MTQRFARRGRRNRPQWLIYNAFLREASQSAVTVVAEPTDKPNRVPMPPILPVKREWRAAMLDAVGQSEQAAS